MDTKEGETDLYRWARQRERDGKDVQQVRAIKDWHGSVVTGSKDEVRRVLKRMKSRKALRPDDIPVVAWKCLGEVAVGFQQDLRA